jgi:hypothetical protein
MLAFVESVSPSIMWTFLGLFLAIQKKKKDEWDKGFWNPYSVKKKKNENEDVQLHGICIFSNHENKLKA